MPIDEEFLAQFDQNPLILKRWLFLADKLEAQLDLLSIPLDNIERWIIAGRIGNTWALDEWKLMIQKAQDSEEGLRELLAFLRNDDERSRQLKSCSPFPGVLTREERDMFTCAWTL